MALVCELPEQPRTRYIYSRSSNPARADEIMQTLAKLTRHESKIQGIYNLRQN